MAQIQNQKILRLDNKNKTREAPEFITEDVVEVRRAKLIYYKWISRLMTVLATIAMLYTIVTTLAIAKPVREMIIDPQ